MKQDCKVSMEQLCTLFGKTRHAYYDKSWHCQKVSLNQSIVLEKVKQIRKKLPKAGTITLHQLLKDTRDSIKIAIGRDKLNDLLSEQNMLVRRRKRSIKTTYSGHWYNKYPNMIRGLIPTKADQLWVSDITYITTKVGYSFLSLVTDAYSRKIVGYCLSKDLTHHGCLKALKMALSGRTSSQDQLIHHSDRGVQYCCRQYVELLDKNQITISMTEKSDPYENAIAERVNGILKTELGLEAIFKDHSQAARAVEEKIEIYNTFRPHSSCDYHTPQQAHLMSGVLKKRWKKRTGARGDSILNLSCKDNQGSEPVKGTPLRCDP